MKYDIDRELLSEDLIDVDYQEFLAKSQNERRYDLMCEASRLMQRVLNSTYNNLHLLETSI